MKLLDERTFDFWLIEAFVNASINGVIIAIAAMFS